MIRADLKAQLKISRAAVKEGKAQLVSVSGQRARARKQRGADWGVWVGELTRYIKAIRRRITKHRARVRAIKAQLKKGG